MPDQVPPDVIVVGGGVIGLSVAWQAATAGMAVTVVDPGPGRGAGWAAAGMLAPVGEAHFGEDAPHRPQRGRGPVLARVRPGARGGVRAARSTTWPDGTLLVALDASDRAATDDLLAYRPGPRPHRPTAHGRPSAGDPSRCWLPGSEGEPTWPRTTRSTTGASSRRWWPPAGPPG